MRTPALVERMELADDADGRVAIFAVGAGEAETGSAPRRLSVPGWVSEALDSPFAIVAVAVALLVLLVLGLMLRR